MSPWPRPSDDEIRLLSNVQPLAVASVAETMRQQTGAAAMSAPCPLSIKISTKSLEVGFRAIRALELLTH